MQVGKSYAGPKDALAMNGAFILEQLLGWEASGAALAGSAFAHALHQEVTHLSEACQQAA